MPLEMANFAGEQNGAWFWGGSRVLVPYGKTLSQAVDVDELIFAELDFQAVLTARYHLPTLRDSNLDLIYRELGRLTAQVGVPPESRRVCGCTGARPHREIRWGQRSAVVLRRLPAMLGPAGRKSVV